MRRLTMGLLLALTFAATQAQSLLYPRHFDLTEVTLLDGPMKQAMTKNAELLLQYDVDRLLTPYVRQSGLGATTDPQSPYYRWEQQHPSFQNWGDNSFNLDGHVGGHYLSALALATAAVGDETTAAALRERMEYMLAVMKDCQDAYDDNTDGLYGFIGGQPINDVWTALYAGDISKYRNRGGWVPFYCEHKILAGLRDAYIYAHNEEARAMFLKLCDWSVNVVGKLTDSQMQTVLDTEHGGMNESLLDAFQLTDDAKYLDAAKKYSHKTMVDGMQTLSRTFLDGRHANTQVPKYIGFERISEQADGATRYRKAADNFWRDVSSNRTVCIGGNSVNEHFLAAGNANRYIDQLDGPESCNSNNMLKLTEMMSDRTADARYADFYEQTLWNHILSTQDPATGGYVYFTTLRPQGYRIYSQVNQAMWCCVGTGMENHSKYGHFVYTHAGADTLFVNLFTPSRLQSADFAVTQETSFPYCTADEGLPTPTTTKSVLTIGKPGHYVVCVRKPAWAGREFAITVGEQQVTDKVPAYGESGYVPISRDWQEGDQIQVSLPMELRYEECPNYTDYVAFKLGPILLGAQTTATSEADAEATGLVYEHLQNEYAGAGRMDHAPGSVGAPMSLTSAPLLIGQRADVLSRITLTDATRLQFSIDASRPDADTYQWSSLVLRPFYEIQHARYMCYWYQQTAENYANSTMAADEARAQQLLQRTLDFVAPGEQQSEAGHEYNYSSDSSTGTYNGERYRDAQKGGYVEYALYNPTLVADSLSVMCRFTTADKGRKASLLVDGTKVADIEVPDNYKGAEGNGFYNVEYPVPATLVTDAEGQVKAKFTVRLAADKGTVCPGLYYLRLMRSYDDRQYRFVCTEWKTGDPGRVQQSAISYDTEQNSIHVVASGSNNVCLMLDYEQTDYCIDQEQRFLVVRGRNLLTTGGSSYLWWLNGSNHGTQVAPDVARTVAIGDGEEQVIAWDMTQSGLYENFTGQRPSVCVGQTIFGLTSKAGQSDITDINFTADVDQYIAQATGLSPVVKPSAQGTQPYYTLGGQRVEHPAQGIYVSRGQKKIFR